MANYSRNNAVNYAVKYALHPNPDYRYFPIINNTSGDCANFLSQCLYAGGIPMSSRWWYRMNGSQNTMLHTWSVSWAVAHSLYWMLKTNVPPLAKEVDSASQLEIGDVMFFEDSKGVIFHSAIVTTAYNGRILISHHSFEALNIPYLASWKGEKLHFLKIIY